MRNHAIHALFLAVVLAPCAVNISAQVPTAFDNIRITPATPNVPMLLEMSNNTIAAASITLLDLLTLEFEETPRDHFRGLTREQLTTRFDVVGKIDPPENFKPQRRRGTPPFFVDALLKNHFHLKAHEAQIDITSEQLLATPSTTKLTPSPPHCSCSRAITVTANHLKGDRISMPALAKELSKQLGVDVSDRTNLPGTYAIDLTWSPEPSTSPHPHELLLREALQTQLGLTLLPMHQQEKVIIIDYIEFPASLM